PLQLISACLLYQSTHSPLLHISYCCSFCQLLHSILLFFFHHPPPSQIYTLSLHDALPICLNETLLPPPRSSLPSRPQREPCTLGDRKSTRLNSSHGSISYAVFCLKKKKKKIK